jgi:hypothetical protein
VPIYLEPFHHFCREAIPVFRSKRHLKATALSFGRKFRAQLHSCLTREASLSQIWSTVAICNVARQKSQSWRNLVRAEKLGLRVRIGSVGVAEAETYKDDAVLACPNTSEVIDQVDRFRRTHEFDLRGVFAFIADVVPQLLRAWPDAACQLALPPSHLGSHCNTVSLRGEAAHPIVVTPCRVGLD